jgi:hypothetical protein
LSNSPPPPAGGAGGGSGGFGAAVSTGLGAVSAGGAAVVGLAAVAVLVAEVSVGLVLVPATSAALPGLAAVVPLDLPAVASALGESEVAVLVASGASLLGSVVLVGRGLSSMARRGSVVVLEAVASVLGLRTANQ